MDEKLNALLDRIVSTLERLDDNIKDCECRLTTVENIAAEALLSSLHNITEEMKNEK